MTRSELTQSCSVAHQRAHQGQTRDKMPIEAFEKVPDYIKYRWLTERRLNASQEAGLGSCDLTLLNPRDKEPFSGALRLPPEILRMIITQLSFHDLENVKAVNTHIRSHVVAFPEYQRVRHHAPALLVALWKTNLSQYFTLCRIHSVLISSQCTVCDQFGAYVFLPGLQRCCQRCAEHDMEFMPISKDVVKKQYGVRNSDMEFLPKLLSREGIYSSSTGARRKYKGKRMLVSRAEARRLGSKDPGNENWIANRDVKAYQRNMALLPLPVLLPNEARVDWGLHCKGCMVAYNKVPMYCMCGIVMPGGVEKSWQGVIRRKQSSRACRHELAADRLHSKEGILEHFRGCEDAKAMLNSNISIFKCSTILRELDDVDEFWQTALDQLSQCLPDGLDLHGLISPYIP